MNPISLLLLITADTAEDTVQCRSCLKTMKHTEIPLPAECLLMITADTDTVKTAVIIIMAIIIIIIIIIIMLTVNRRPAEHRRRSSSIRDKTGTVIRTDLLQSQNAEADRCGSLFFD